MSAPSVGEQLKTARTKLGVTIKEVAQATKIQPWVLEAVEADRLASTMSPIYSRSFVSAYAKYLQLDPKPLLTVLFPEAAPVQAVAAKAKAAPAKTRTVAVTAKAVAAATAKRTTSAPARPAVLAEVAEPVAMQTVAFERAVEPVDETAVELAPVAAVANPAAPQVRESRPRIEPTAPMWSWPKISWQALRYPATVAAGLVALVAVVRTNPFHALSAKFPHQQASVSVSMKKPASAKQEMTVQLASDQPLELAITAHRAMWVSVKSDGKLLAQRQLVVGAQEIWRANKKLEVILAKPSQADVTINGQVINPLVIAHRGRLLITHKQIEAIPEF